MKGWNDEHSALAKERNVLLKKYNDLVEESKLIRSELYDFSQGNIFYYYRGSLDRRLKRIRILLTEVQKQLSSINKEIKNSIKRYDKETRNKKVYVVKEKISKRDEKVEKENKKKRGK